jgi:hypothetical protein
MFQALSVTYFHYHLTNKMKFPLAGVHPLAAERASAEAWISFYTNNFFITTHLNHCLGHIKDIDISLYQ